MNLIYGGALLVAGGLVAKYFFGKGEPSDGGVPADAAAPNVPVDENGVVVTGPAPSGGAKIPPPQKPVGWQPVPRFIQKGGVSYYNPAYVNVLAAMLGEYDAKPTNADKSRAILSAKEPGQMVARPWVRYWQGKGYHVLAANTLLDGEAGQLGTSMIAVTNAQLKALPASSAAVFSVLPKLPGW